MIHKLLCVAMLTQDGPPPPQNEVQALIQEVRNLRTALDRTTFVGLRVQLVLHRLGQQMQVVHQARESATNLQRFQAELRTRKEGTERQIQDWEQRKRAVASKPGELERVEREGEWIKREAESLPKRLQEVEISAIEAQQTLRTEQAKLDDLNRQLDELEKRLAEIGK